jgi:hypothetical protein
MYILRFPIELADRVLHKGSRLLEVDFDGDYQAFIEVGFPALRSFVAVEVRALHLPTGGPEIVEIDLMENLGVFSEHNLSVPASAMGWDQKASLKFRTPEDEVTAALARNDPDALANEIKD